MAGIYVKHRCVLVVTNFIRERVCNCAQGMITTHSRLFVCFAQNFSSRLVFAITSATVKIAIAAAAATAAIDSRFDLDYCRPATIHCVLCCVCVRASFYERKM